MIFKQNKKYTHLHSVQKSSRPALNAWFVLLEHQRVFESSLIVTYESLSRPRCENMDLHIIQSLLERVQIHTNTVKPKN